MQAIFLDRDGVINRKPREGAYVAAAGDLHFLPGSLDAIARFSRNGYAVFIVTNQRGIARGVMTSQDLELVHARLYDSVHDRGGRIQKIYVCTHDHHEQCQCRKPRPGMLLQARREYGVDLTASWMIGDSATDLIAGRQAGCRTALIRNDNHCPVCDADLVGNSLAEVARHILRLKLFGKLNRMCLSDRHV